MKQAPLITTIITTYRRPFLLERAIKSVLAQSYPHFRLIICDNASGDETENIIRNFTIQDPRIVYHKHPQNIGMMDNYVYGLECVETKYCSFLSDDDVVLPEFYQEALEQFKKYPQAAFFAGSTIVATGAGRVLSASLEAYPKNGLYKQSEALFCMTKNYPILNTILLRTDCIAQVGSIDKQAAIVWDLDLLIRLAIEYPVIFYKQPLGVFLSHESSYSSVAGICEWRLGWGQAMNNLRKGDSSNKKIQKLGLRLIEKNLKRFIFSSGVHFLFTRRFKEAQITSKMLVWEDVCPFKGGVLLLAALVCKYIPFGYKGLIFMQKIKKSTLQDRKNTLQDRYGIYAKKLMIGTL